jgi:Domain of unknown function (DUF4160)
LPKLDAFSVPGLDLVFHSDDHAPPHFHATRPGEWSIRVFILETASAGALEMEEVFARKKPRGRLLRELREAVVEHKEELLREWEEKVQKGN